MIQRFHIEDLVFQDRSGVVFRALDTETGGPVAIQRFFPFGPDGGGLCPEEQVAYEIAIERLAKVAHPALRAVLGGGCDPIDKIPYIVTEWVDGPRLSAFVEHASLTPPEAIHLLDQAMEVCELLSELLAEEAVWIATDLDSIIVGDEGSGRGITFWISPLKWLMHQEGEHGMEAISSLTEEIMGWTKKRSISSLGSGIGAWLKWLRSVEKSASLHEARAKLATSAQLPPPGSSKHLIRDAKREAAKRRSPRFAPIFWLTASLVAMCSAGWLLARWDLHRRAETVMIAPQAVDVILSPLSENLSLPATASESSFRSLPSEAPLNRRDQIAFTLSTPPPQVAEVAKGTQVERHDVISSNGRIFSAADNDLLLAHDTKDVTVEGVLEALNYSSKPVPRARTLYLQFSKNPTARDTRGAVILKGAPSDLRADQLETLIGKRIRMTGKVKVETKARHQAPIIVIDKRSSIQEVK